MKERAGIWSLDGGVIFLNANLVKREIVLKGV